MSSAVTGLSDYRQARRGRRISRAAQRVRRGRDGRAPEATRERGRPFLAGVGSATVSFATSAVLDAERDLRLRVGVDTAGATRALGFRPSPSSFASIERRSE